MNRRTRRDHNGYSLNYLDTLPFGWWVFYQFTGLLRELVAEVRRLRAEAEAKERLLDSSYSRIDHLQERLDEREEE